MPTKGEEPLPVIDHDPVPELPPPRPLPGAQSRALQGRGPRRSGDRLAAFLLGFLVFYIF